MLRAWLLFGVCLSTVALPISRSRAGEIIREQDAAGRVRVIREVAEDARGNCLNHGLWQQLDADGRVCGEGRFEMGLRTGEWRRWLGPGDVPAELATTLTGFELPLESRAAFVGGRLNGAWTIADARGRRCLSAEFVAGVRQGKLRAWAPGGELVREETYDRGRIDGEALAWSDAEQRLVHVATWVRGYRLVRTVSFYEGATPAERAEGEFLLGPSTLSAADDFWATRLADSQLGAACIPHGAWRAWFPGGQLAAEGRYAWGRPVGEFVWRHPNGQKATAGSYDAAGRPEGAWRWWNADGQQVALRQVPVADPASRPVKMASRPAAGDVR
jgi:antitoxin component YwqK of YwqJK toxin-antitoxin module